VARLLVVDNDDDVRDLIVWQVIQAGHEALSVPIAAAALAAVDRHGLADAVLLDVDLDECRDGMDGIDLLTALRQTAPDLPAAVITGLRRPPVPARVRAAGAVLTTKRFTAAIVRATVTDVTGSAERSFA
jgi:CheY-like chemotaxis protein